MSASFNHWILLFLLYRENELVTFLIMVKPCETHQIKYYQWIVFKAKSIWKPYIFPSNNQICLFSGFPLKVPLNQAIDINHIYTPFSTLPKILQPGQPIY